jgi:hypothetical protein
VPDGVYGQLFLAEKMRAVRTSDTDEALEQVYSMNARRLLDAARSWTVGA